MKVRQQKSPRRLRSGVLLFLGLLLLPMKDVSGQQTVAQFSSSFGDFDVLLFDRAVPRTVGNFAAYAEAALYDNSFIHRSTTYNPSGIQIIQGGGFILPSTDPEAAVTMVDEVPLFPPIPLQAGLLNRRGTLAMARTSEPDTATSQWFFNVQDNTGLDPSLNGPGYAVFGEVLGEGMTVVDAMAEQSVFNFGGVFAELPLRGTGEPVVSNFLRVDRIRKARFAVTEVRRQQEGVRVAWSGPSAATPVTVERSGDLAGGVWTVVSSNNTNGFFFDTGVGAASSVFYRVVVP